MLGEHVDGVVVVHVRKNLALNTTRLPSPSPPRVHRQQLSRHITSGPAIHHTTIESRANKMSTAASTPDVEDTQSSTTRRKSGRVSRKPQKYAPGGSPTGSTKRKRGDDDDSGVDANDASSEEESESSEGEPDEEELRERQRKRKSKSASRKPAPKKSKSNGESLSLAIRPASNATKTSKRSRKAPVRKSTLPEHIEGLYGRLHALARVSMGLTCHSRCVCQR